MIHNQSTDGYVEYPAGTIPASAFDQLNYACNALTDQLLHIVISFDGRLREKYLKEALLAAIHHCPVLGCRFRETEHPYWEPAPSSCHEGLLRIHDTGDPELILRQVLVRPIDVIRNPPIRLDLIRSETDMLCITLHHAVGDARAILDCVRLIANLYRDMSPRGSVPQPPGFLGRDRSNHCYLSLIPQEREGAVDFGIPTLPEPGFFPFQSRDCDARDVVIRNIQPGQLEQILSYGRARSATADAVLLAATALAFRRFQQPAAGGMIPLLHSLDLRRHYPGPASFTGGMAPAGYDICNRSVPFEVLLPCDPGQTLDSLVILAAATLRRVRESDAALLEVLKAEELAKKGFTTIRDYIRNAQESYLRNGCGSPFFVNAGVLPEPCFDFGPDLPVAHAFLAAGIATSPPGVVVTASSFHNRLTLTFGFCSKAISRDTAARLLDAMVAAITEREA
jgi:NRPS condensation-like uncharacterized protein